MIDPTERMSFDEARERRRFVHYDSAGGVSVDIGAYLRSPLGRAHLRALARWDSSTSQGPTSAEPR